MSGPAPSLTPNRDAALQAIELMRRSLDQSKPPTSEVNALWRQLQGDLTASTMLFYADAIDREVDPAEALSRVLTALAPAVASLAMTASDYDGRIATGTADVMMRELTTQVRGWLNNPKAFGSIVAVPAADELVRGRV